MSGGGVEAGDTALAEMVGAARSIYPRDKSGACRSGYGGIDGYRGSDRQKVRIRKGVRRTDK